ncbi:MAG TPA: alpha/beta hydrolase family protein [Vicinamibacterales bacterium]|nr:alpha/beta hydrolase family protein [Vicinamibacterales bacterium]
MLSRVFHEWERRLAAAATDRVIRPFEWGADWLHDDTADGSEEDRLERWAAAMLAESDRFYALEPTDDYTLTGDRLTFPSAIRTPHPENNVVHARFFPNQTPRGRRRAVVVLPQWNAGADGHVGLCQLLNRFGLSALRLTLPYHDERRPQELRRADYIVSSNIGRTMQVCRQAVLDARRAIAWLAREGYESIGILGTSLGSCLSMLTAAHEPLVKAAALNHISPYFADVVWEGLSTAHVRHGLEGHIDLDQLRRIWLPISPLPYLDRVRNKRILLVYARYDLTFPVRLSRMLVDEFRRLEIDHDLHVLPCGHYSTGVTPFKWIDGLTLCRFLSRSL